MSELGLGSSNYKLVCAAHVSVCSAGPIPASLSSLHAACLRASPVSHCNLDSSDDEVVMVTVETGFNKEALSCQYLSGPP